MSADRTPCLRPGGLRVLAVSLALAAGAATALAADPKAARYYEDALTRYEARDIPGAIVQLKSALQAERTLLPAHVLLGKALLANGEVVAAEAAFEEALRLGVSRGEVVLPLARAVSDQARQHELIDKGRFDIAGLAPDIQSQLLLIKASALSDLGNARDALRSVEQARTLSPSLIDTWLAEVPVRLRARQIKEAQAAADSALAMAPGSALALYAAASVQHVKGDLKAALASYDKVLAADPAMREARVARAGVLFDLKRFDEAGAELTELLRQDPKEPRGWYLSALLAEREGRQPAAKAAMQRITGLLDRVPIQLMRYRPQMLLLNGQAHYALGEDQKAKPYFEAIQRIQPGTPVSKLLATIQLAEGKQGQAIDSLELYLRSFPADAQAMALLASAHMAKGRHARAATLMQDALRRNDEPGLHAAYGLSLIGIGENADAITHLETAYRKDASQTQAAYALVGLYLRGGQQAKGLALANTLVARQPANPSFANLLGLAKVESRDLTGARASFEQALKLDPSMVAASLNLARLEIGTLNVDRAQTVLDGVLKVDDKNTEAMFALANLAQRRGDSEGAVRWLQKGHDVGGSSDLRPGLALVDLHLRNGRREDAMRVASQLSANYPDNLKVLVAHSRAQLASGDFAGMRASLNNATRVAEYNAPAQVEVALLQMAARNLPGAAYSLDKALNEKPDFLPALVLSSEVFTKQGEFAKAEQVAQQIVKREPRLAIGYSLLGDLAMARRQLPAAIDAYRKAHQVQAGFGTLGSLVRSLAMQDSKASLKLLEDWTRARPTDLAARNMLAEAHVRSGNMQGARREYEAVRAQNPKDSAVLNNLANVLLLVKDPQALPVAEQALALSPNDVTVIDTAGWVALRSGKLDRGLQLLRDARLRDPDNPEIRYHLAAALVASDREAEARQELETAQRSKLPFDSRAEAEALLKTLK